MAFADCGADSRGEQDHESKCSKKMENHAGTKSRNSVQGIHSLHVCSISDWADTNENDSSAQQSYAEIASRYPVV